MKLSEQMTLYGVCGVMLLMVIAICIQLIDWEYVTRCAKKEEISQGQWCCAQPCPTLWGPLDCSLPGSSIHGIFFFFFGRNTGVGCHFLLHRVFLIQGSNPCLLHLLHCRADSLPLSYLGNPRRVVLHALKWNSRVFVIRSTICQVVYFHSKQL